MLVGRNFGSPVYFPRVGPIYLYLYPTIDKIR
jgi:hypothetical protein